ncbi:hypothetical protein LAZ67_3004804 [Cordylochernes scorpioides]|uniref:Uncharacterized protein n=1 Tax=Cordylochernes scorpioides TaxID=51811 RepID=A0ABY6KBJ3_9ARAC|nr:hypothetical protein LAZ67_3004804 [Cordylochernes scorpioides]
MEGLNEEWGYFFVKDVVSEVLGYKKMSARWVPKKLTEEHKIKRVESATEFFCRYEEDAMRKRAKNFWIRLRNLGTSLHPGNEEPVETMALPDLTKAEKVRDAAGELYDAGIKKLLFPGCKK